MAQRERFCVVPFGVVNIVVIVIVIKKLIQQPTKSTTISSSTKATANISNKTARHKTVRFRLPLQTGKAYVTTGSANDKYVSETSRSLSNGIAKYTNQLICALHSLK